MRRCRSEDAELIESYFLNSNLKFFHLKEPFMKKNVLAVVITVIFINLIITILDRSFTIREFIPFYNIIVNRALAVDAYDIFLAISILFLRSLYAYHGINHQTLASLRYLIYPRDLKDTIIMAVAGLITHFCIYPWLIQTLAEPITALTNSPDPIRKVIIINLPLLWLLVVSLINKRAHSTQTMPATTW